VSFTKKQQHELVIEIARSVFGIHYYVQRFTCWQGATVH